MLDANEPLNSYPYLMQHRACNRPSLVIFAPNKVRNVAQLPATGRGSFSEGCYERFISGSPKTGRRRRPFPAFAQGSARFRSRIRSNLLPVYVWLAFATNAISFLQFFAKPSQHQHECAHNFMGSMDYTKSVGQNQSARKMRAELEIEDRRGSDTASWSMWRVGNSFAYKTYQAEAHIATKYMVVTPLTTTPPKWHVLALYRVQTKFGDTRVRKQNLPIIFHDLVKYSSTTSHIMNNDCKKLKKWNCIGRKS